jgi:ribosome biogenesis protein ERB1
MVKRKDEIESEEELDFTINSVGPDDTADDSDGSDVSDRGLQKLEQKRLDSINLRMQKESQKVEESERSQEANTLNDTDTSDEDEDTIGNIPLWWYDDYDHIGYDRDGKKLLKGAKKDEIDQFLTKQNFVYDKFKNEIKLTKEEMDLMERIRNHQFPAGFDPYQEQIEFFSGKAEVLPLNAAPEPKRRFVPSKNESRMIMRIAAKIRAARREPQVEKKEKPKYYDIWDGEDDKDRKVRNQIQAPKINLPGNFHLFRAHRILQSSLRISSH